MGRRWPPLENLTPAHDPSVTGFAEILPATSGIAHELRQLTIASNGGAGTASFSYAGGAAFKQLSIPANGTADCNLPAGAAGPIGSGLFVNTSADMAVTAWHVDNDERTGVEKEQARADTHSAYLAQKAAGQHAIRTPNRFGGQGEG